MKIAVCTIGSTGDIQPYLALALALRAAGHAVRVISHPFHARRFDAYGLEYHACGPVTSQQDLNEMLDRMLARPHPVAQLQLLMQEAFFAEGESYFFSARAALMGCDLAIVHMVDFLGAEAAAQLGIPRIGGVLAPAGIPSAYGPPPHLPDWGRYINPLWWRAVDLVLRHVDREAMDFLRRVGGPSVEIKGFHTLAPDLNLLACSTALAPVFQDLPPNIKPVGPWILDEPEFTPSAELEGFFERYPRPVVVSFGSMGGTKGPWLARQVLRALQQTGQPAVIQSGYSDLMQEQHPENVMFAGYVPHGWLFQRAGMVVHHCGAGTTTAVARAGVPHVPVSFIADQPYFARRLRQLGVAARPLMYNRLTPGRLARRLREASAPEMMARAQALGTQVRAETDMQATVRIIEEYMSKHRP